MDIHNRLKKHWEVALEHCDESRILGLFLVGSQNYGLSVETSDVDTKLIIVPSLEDIYKGEIPESKTYVVDNEQLVVKDVRAFAKELEKVNPNVLETLYTDYFIINPIYEEIFNDLKKSKEDIVRQNSARLIKTTIGMAISYYKRMYDSDGKINSKMVANILRLNYLISNYIEGATFDKCLRPEDKIREDILSIRNGEYGQQSMRILADTTVENMRQLEEEFASIVEDSNNGQSALYDFVKDSIDLSFFREYAERGEL